MSGQERDNSGVLFKNEERKTDKSPVYSGKAMVDGVQYRIAGWIKEGSSGNTFLSLAFTPMDQEESPRQSYSRGSGRRDSSF